MIDGIKYITDLIVPVTGKLTIVVGDDDACAMMISVGVAVKVIISVTVGVNDETKVGVGVLDGIGVGALVAIGIRVGRGAAAFC